MSINDAITWGQASDTIHNNNKPAYEYFLRKSHLAGKLKKKKNILAHSTDHFTQKFDHTPVVKSTRALQIV